MDQKVKTPVPANEPVLSYAAGTTARAALKKELCNLLGERPDIPLIIGGREVRTGQTAQAVIPHRHGHVLATWHKAGKAEVEQAVKAALEARREWSSWRWEERATVFLRAAELLATTWRPVLNGATMLHPARTADEFIAAIGRVLASGREPAARVAAAKELAPESWAGRCAEMAALVARHRPRP